MKQILSYVREYIREEWYPAYFASVGAFLVACFTLNYSLEFEQRSVRQLAHPLAQLLFYLFFYGIPYVIVLALYARFSRRRFARERGFHVLVLFGIVLLSVYITLHNVPAFAVGRSPSLLAGISRDYHWYIARYASNILPGLVMLIPLAVYWRRNDRFTSRFYGFSSSSINLTTYFTILLLLIPIIFAASYGADFQAAYPRYKFGLPVHAEGFHRGLLVAAFEVCYGLDFISVELLFRGFFVMAFARYLGAGAILPMVVVYALIHFQKPMGEAIGSVFGGLVLGVIAYRTKSIYGGVILHLGVAYLMELAGTMQLMLR